MAKGQPQEWSGNLFLALPLLIIHSVLPPVQYKHWKVSTNRKGWASVWIRNSRSLIFSLLLCLSQLLSLVLSVVLYNHVCHSVLLPLVPPGLPEGLPRPTKPRLPSGPRGCRRIVLRARSKCGGNLGSEYGMANKFEQALEYNRSTFTCTMSCDFSNCYTHLHMYMYSTCIYVTCTCK